VVHAAGVDEKAWFGGCDAGIAWETVLSDGEKLLSPFCADTLAAWHQQGKVGNQRFHASGI
jgi:hypothetical protein